jgi:hypothetical protein
MNRIAWLHLPGASAPVEEATTQRTRSRRRGSRVRGVLVALVVTALGAYGTLWAVASLHLRTGVLDWIAARQAEGYRIAYADLGLGGFPFASRVTVLAPVVTAPDGRALGWSWAGDRADVEASPFRPSGITLRLGGEEALSINVDGKLKTYRGGAEELTLRTTSGASTSAGELTVRGLALSAEEAGDVIGLERLTATGAAGAPAVAPAPTSVFALTIDAVGLRLPQHLNLPLGGSIGHLAADATVHGAVGSVSNLREGLARWRESGGYVDLAQLGFTYGPLTLHGGGTLALDAAAQPVGAFTARIQGFQQTISALNERGIIDDQVAAKAKIALAVLSQRPDDGGPPTLRVPMSLHDRTVSVGPLPLFAIPEIQWPRGPSLQGWVPPPGTTAHS